jgi:hypothetical protein
MVQNYHLIFKRIIERGLKLLDCGKPRIVMQLYEFFGNMVRAHLKLVELDI